MMQFLNAYTDIICTNSTCSATPSAWTPFGGKAVQKYEHTSCWPRWEVARGACATAMAQRVLLLWSETCTGGRKKWAAKVHKQIGGKDKAIHGTPHFWSICSTGQL